MLLASDIIVSEFMAFNDHLVQDFDRNSPDWIELSNVSSETVNLKGWYLTDDESELTQWRIPVETLLTPQENLTLFASGRNFIAPDGELHTNFQLAREGEFLALVRPDGVSVEWQLPDVYPHQFPNVSYGHADRTSVSELINLRAVGRVTVPNNGLLDQIWTTTDFDDSDWSEGSARAGFFTVGEPVEVTGFVVRMVDINGGTDGILDTAVEARDVLESQFDTSAYAVTRDESRITQQINFGGFRGAYGDNIPYLDNTVDSSLENIAMDARATVTIPEGDWTIGLGIDDGGILRLDGVNFIKTFLEDGTPELITAGDGELIRNEVSRHKWVRGTFTVGPGGLTTPLRALFFNRDGNDTFELAIIRGHATNRPRSTNDWTLLSDGKLGWSVKSLTPPAVAQLGDLVSTNLELQMFQEQSSAYMRIPFTVTDTSQLVKLTLRMRYADGFVAYLNGQEVARANVSGNPDWNSSADSVRTEFEARTPYEFDISQHTQLLQVGNNVLAIQATNSHDNSPTFLLVPELWATEQLPSGMAFLGDPTPGEANGAGSIAALSPVTFSHDGGTFVNDFPLTLASEAARATIYYTTDGSVPSRTSLLYSSPINIDQTSQITAMAFAPGLVPSFLSGQTYVKLAEDILSFTSDLPLIVLENFDQGIPERDWQTAIGAVIEPNADGRSALTGPVSVISKIGMHRRGYSTYTHEKTNYRIEFRDELGYDKNVKLLDFPEESDWILSGPWVFDRTMVRNPMMFELSNQIGHYSPRTRFVEVFADTNGDSLSQQDYMGVYVLTEVIKQGANRVEVAKLKRSHVEEPEITGGYVQKIDRGTAPTGSSKPPDVWRSSRGGPQIFNNMDPQGDQLTQAQHDYLLGYVDAFETALYGSNYTDTERGYEAFVDVDSFLKHHWLRLLSHDPDGLIVSTYWVKDRGKKLQMGPMWDFDRTMGNDLDRRSADPREIAPQYLTYAWWHRLFSDPNFKQRWIDFYQKLRREENVFTNENFASIIDRLTDQVREAQVRNVERWPNTSPNGGEFSAPRLSGYAAEVSHLKGWLNQRLIWLDSLFLVPPTLRKTAGREPSEGKVTFASTTHPIYYTTDGTDPRGDRGAVSPGAKVFDGQPIFVNKTTKIIARVYDADGSDMKVWSSPTLETSSTDIIPADGESLRVTELHYHPAEPTADESAAGFSDANDFEFAELTNISEVAIELRDVRLDEVSVDGDNQGIRFEFEAQTLGPGESIVVVNNIDGFVYRYGPDIRTALGIDWRDRTNGEYGGRLSNGGETVTLRAADKSIIQQFSYNDNWHRQTDGGGFSLEMVDPGATDISRWNKKAAWQPSAQLGGNPGILAIVHGDFTGDGFVNVADIDRLFAELLVVDPHDVFDLSGDDLVDDRDAESLVTDILGTRFGDIDLDGNVDMADFDDLARNFGTTRDSWSDGNLDGDGDVDFTDFNLLSNNFGFVRV